MMTKLSSLNKTIYTDYTFFCMGHSVQSAVPLLTNKDRGNVARANGKKPAVENPRFELLMLLRPNISLVIYINITLFCHDILSSRLITPPPSTLSALVNCYKSFHSQLLNQRAPLKSKIIRTEPRHPRFT